MRLRGFIRFAAALILLSAGLSGCASKGADLPMLETDRSVDADYRLGPGDKLNVTVLGAQDLSGEFTVGDTGTISAPLIGEIKAAGLARAQLEQAIADTLARNVVKNPKVSVSIAAYRPFYIFGEVAKSGAYPYASGMRVLSAIALAGGYTYRAEEHYVIVTRRGEDRKALPSTAILPDDIIRIPQRFF